MKCFEVLKRLKVKRKQRDAVWTYPNFMAAMAEAELEVVDFIEASYELVSRMSLKDEDRSDEELGGKPGKGLLNDMISQGNSF